MEWPWTFDAFRAGICVGVFGTLIYALVLTWAARHDR